MEFVKYISISFFYNVKRYSHRIEKSDIQIDKPVDTWFYYFDEDGLRFEVWGGLDVDGEPVTGGTDKYGHCTPFAVNVYQIEDAEGTQLDQIDDVDVDECI